MTAKEEILELLQGLTEAPTYADAFYFLRPLYNREVAPIIAQYGNPPRPHGHWRCYITGQAEAEKQKRVQAEKADLVGLMQLLSTDATAEELRLWFAQQCEWGPHDKVVAVKGKQ